jgi:hypothetical protein
LRVLAGIVGLLAIVGIAIVLTSAGNKNGDAFPPPPTQPDSEARPMTTLIARTRGAPRVRVTLDPPGGRYPMGSVVLMRAQAPQGYVFKQWVGPLADTNKNPTRVSMNRARKEITAVFEHAATHRPRPENASVREVFPEADAFISMDVNLDKSFGNLRRFLVSPGNSRCGLLRFDLREFSGRIGSAHLLLQSPGGKNAEKMRVKAFRVADVTWKESEVSRKNRPAAGGLLGEWRGDNRTPSIDITQAARAAASDPGKLSIVVKCPDPGDSNTSVTYGTREAHQVKFRPRLELVLTDE